MKCPHWGCFLGWNTMMKTLPCLLLVGGNFVLASTIGLGLGLEFGIDEQIMHGHWALF